MRVSANAASRDDALRHPDRESTATRGIMGWIRD